MLKGRLKRLSAFPVSQHWGGLYLYYDERRDIRWNIAWARGKSQGRSLRNFPRAQAIFHRLFQLESKCRHSHFLKVILPVLSFLVGQYWKSWFSLLVWQLGLYFPVLPRRWSNTGPYRPSRELCCGSTRKHSALPSGQFRQKSFLKKNIGRIDSPYWSGSWCYIFPYCPVDEAVGVRIDPVENSVLAALGNIHGQDSNTRRV